MRNQVGQHIEVAATDEIYIDFDWLTASGFILMVWISFKVPKYNQGNTVQKTTRHIRNSKSIPQYNYFP